jgi:predicted RNA-binding protein associated with RNAse of E/G family
MTKLEKHFIKTMVKDILEIEAEALQYTSDDFDNSYAVDCFAEETYNDIKYYIDIMIDRGVNKNIINQLDHLNFALFNRNVHLTRIYQGW